MLLRRAQRNKHVEFVVAGCGRKRRNRVMDCSPRGLSAMELAEEAAALNSCKQQLFRAATTAASSNNAAFKENRAVQSYGEAIVLDPTNALLCARSATI